MDKRKNILRNLNLLCGISCNDILMRDSFEGINGLEKLSTIVERIHNSNDNLLIKETNKTINSRITELSNKINKNDISWEYVEHLKNITK